jgi:hypothetical protein
MSKRYVANTLRVPSWIGNFGFKAKGDTMGYWEHHICVREDVKGVKKYIGDVGAAWSKIYYITYFFKSQEVLGAIKSTPRRPLGDIGKAPKKMFLRPKKKKTHWEWQWC